MEQIPIVSLADYKILRELTKEHADPKSPKEIKQLSAELDRAVVYKEDQTLPDDIIRINSHVEIEDMQLKKSMKVQLVLPSEANIKVGKISIIAPLGAALIGFKENDEVEWEMPAGIKKIKILKVTQPEL